MTKKEAINYCVKQFRKSKMNALFSVIIAGIAVGNVYRHAYRAAVYRTGQSVIERCTDDDDDVALSINGKEV